MDIHFEQMNLANIELYGLLAKWVGWMCQENQIGYFMLITNKRKQLHVKPISILKWFY